MKNETMVIFDYELDYANNLMNYMNRKKVLPFTVQVFTDLSKLDEYLKNNKIEVLLISHDVDIELLNRANINNIYFLSEGKYVNEGFEHPSIYKFQPVSNILDEILLFYADSKTLLTTTTQKSIDDKINVIGVFSPLGSCGKTIFALTIGQILSHASSVLYINLESFSAFHTIINNHPEKGLSELIYYLREKKINLGMKIKSLTGSINQMDYIASCNCCMDLLEVKIEEWEFLIEELNKNSTYNHIILDIGFLNQDILKLLDSCDVVYMPIKTDLISKAKIKEFENISNIYALDMDMLTDKIIHLNLPYDKNLDKTFDESSFNLELLTKGTLGEYTSLLLSDLTN